MSSAFSPCRSCQRRVVDVFASLAGVSLPPVRQRAPRQRTFDVVRIPIISQSTRSYHVTSRRLQAIQGSNTEQRQSLAATTDADTSSTSIAQTEPCTTSDASIPWYLRVEPPKPLATSLAPNLAAQELPCLPEDPPAILQPILDHLSISIGLDHLSILDLRDLSPPPALGANLIMILGTARSEKHLNTSADRLCRWLRSTYKLRPYADGLLGRNELKLKLRRRNKKIKLAQSVGNTTMFGEDGKKFDDGITTGWVCVNLGGVDAAIIPKAEITDGVTESTKVEPTRELHPVLSSKDQERILEDEDNEYTNPAEDFQYRGFGSASHAPRIVVQMFTEQKRLEMDLEGLWEARLSRRDAKNEKLDHGFGQEEFEVSQIEEEIENPAVREGMAEHRPMGAIASS